MIFNHGLKGKGACLSGPRDSQPLDSRSQIVAPHKRIERIVLKTATPKNRSEQEIAGYRLPAMMLAELKRLANKRDVPYQSLLKIFIAERLDEELRGSESK
jgi:hypothetical protein